MSTPLTDLVAFLTAETPEYLALGPARFVVVLVFYVLTIVSLVLVVENAARDRAQRSARLLWLGLSRIIVGWAWFKIMLDTLPLGGDNALHRWLDQAAKGTAAPQLARFTSETLLPHVALVDALAFLATFLVAASFILGGLVRIGGFLALLLTVAAWLGLYDDPNIWFWGFPLLALLCGILTSFAAGRAFGADAWARRAVPSVRDGRGLGRVLRWLT